VVGVGPVRDIPEGRRTVFASVILRCPWAAGAASFLFFSGVLRLNKSILVNQTKCKVKMTF
jgi:hypothetical protein